MLILPPYPLSGTFFIFSASICFYSDFFFFVLPHTKCWLWLCINIYLSLPPPDIPLKETTDRVDTVQLELCLYIETLDTRLWPGQGKRCDDKLDLELKSTELIIFTDTNNHLCQRVIEWKPALCNLTIRWKKSNGTLYWYFHLFRLHWGGSEVSRSNRATTFKALRRNHSASGLFVF